MAVVMTSAAYRSASAQGLPAVFQYAGLGSVFARTDPAAPKLSSAARKAYMPWKWSTWSGALFPAKP